jgi:plastocyanin
MPSNSLRFLTGGLALFSLMLALGCGGGGMGYGSTPTTTPVTTQPPAAGVADLTITIAGDSGNMSFSPSAATVKVGQKVAWRNADSIVHAVVEDDNGIGPSPYSGSGFGTGTIAPGATSAPFEMKNAGTTGYHCSIHPSMVGTLTATQ